MGVKLSNNNNLDLIIFFFNRYIKKILAFTLAEILIVMGIIDVVAAWIINTGNIDYLDVFHEEGTLGKCKHSNKTLSTTVTSCK
ncbi:MAG: type II secretion system protein [Candidatus Gastranaerophilaceae bacterium]